MPPPPPALVAAKPRPAKAPPAAAALPGPGVPAIAPVFPGAAAPALPMPRAVEGAADDPLLANPLARLERLSTCWFGVIADFEGVVVDSTLEVYKEAWRRVAAEMGLRPPLGSALARIDGARDDTVIMQLFTWTRDPSVAARISARKEEIYDELMNGNTPAEAPGFRAFLETLHKNKIPVAVASQLPERRVRAALDRLGLSRVCAVAAAEGAGGAGAELEGSYLAASHMLGRPPLRCAVLGAANRSLEAAHELGMKAVAVAGGRPAFEFGGADLVVRSPAQLSVVNLKRLFGEEGPVESSVPWEEVRASREAAERSGGRQASGGFGGFGSFGGSSSVASSSTALGWPAGGGMEEDGEEEEEDSRAWERDLQPAAAASGAAGSGAAAAAGAAAGAGDDEDFEPILPPPGAAFWDLRR